MRHQQNVQSVVVVFMENTLRLILKTKKEIEMLKEASRCIVFSVLLVFVNSFLSVLLMHCTGFSSRGQEPGPVIIYNVGLMLIGALTFFFVGKVIMKFKITI